MNADELQRDLLALRLATPSELDEARRKAGSAGIEPLLAELESANVLTPYLSGKLRKGETKGLVLGGYKVMYRNASGSFARVYRAQSLDDGSMVGLKVLRDRWASEAKNVAQFHREAEMGKKLRHPNIAPIYDIGVTDDYHWFSMEFVEGGNLRDFIKIRKKVEPAETLRYLHDIALGLDYALGVGFTHRDLKMTNVLMSINGVAKLIDFGLAGQGVTPVESEQSRAIEYAALEKGTKAPNNDPRSDIYFLGGIVYELLTGEPPYPRTRDREARASFARYRNVRPIRQLEPTLPQPVVELVDRMLKVDPRQRFQHPREVLGEAKQALDGLGTEPQSGGNSRRKGPSSEDAKTTVLCIEDRTRHQDMLREYFTKHGYRVLVMTDVQRAINRLERNPPDCAVLMGGSIGDGVVEAYGEAVKKATGHPTAIIAVLAESQRELESKMTADDKNRVLARVATLRDLRQEIDSVTTKKSGSADR